MRKLVDVSGHRRPEAPPKDLNEESPVLGKDFYSQPTLKVARQLIGKLLVHQLSSNQRIVVKIVETEGYCQDDPACHAYSNYQKHLTGKKISGRSIVLFGEPGIAYVYLNYGMYWLFNIVTEKKGVAGAVLIRAVEPLDGIEFIKKHRPHVKSVYDLTNGPGKVSLALNIDQRFHGKPVMGGQLFVSENHLSPRKIKIGTSGRIGINKAQDLPWRFFEFNNRYVSKY